jgi:hypothetical protein
VVEHLFFGQEVTVNVISKENLVVVGKVQCRNLDNVTGKDEPFLIENNVRLPVSCDFTLINADEMNLSLKFGACNLLQ